MLGVLNMGIPRSIGMATGGRCPTRVDRARTASAGRFFTFSLFAVVGSFLSVNKGAAHRFSPPRIYVGRHPLYPASDRSTPSRFHATHSSQMAPRHVQIGLGAFPHFPGAIPILRALIGVSIVVVESLSETFHADTNARLYDLATAGHEGLRPTEVSTGEPKGSCSNYFSLATRASPTRPVVRAAMATRQKGIVKSGLAPALKPAL